MLDMEGVLPVRSRAKASRCSFSLRMTFWALLAILCA